RPDCVAGHVGLELRNVVANYPFESSHNFPGFQPNSGHADHSRLSCDIGDMQLGATTARVRTEGQNDRLPELAADPTTGIAGCCARATSGHAAAPPSSVMNGASSFDHLVGAGE